MVRESIQWVAEEAAERRRNAVSVDVQQALKRSDAARLKVGLTETEGDLPDVPVHHDDYDLIRNYIASLEQQLTAAREREGDARRYAWLRVDVAQSAVPRVWQSNEDAEPTRCLHGDELDEAIDEAIAQESAK